MEFIFIIGIVALIAIFYYFFYNKNIEQIKEDLKKEDTIKILVFTTDTCGACQNYKANKHEELKNELLQNNIEMELFENDEEAFKNYQIQWFPTFIVEKNNKLMKLSMQDSPTYDNLMNVVKIMV